MINDIFQLILIPLLAALTGFLVKWINTKTATLKAQSDNELAQKYLTMLNDTITDCIVSTNQTYVNALKDKGDFTVEAQKEAFEKTFENVKSMLNSEAETYLQNLLGDLNVYITTRIESQVYVNKQETK